MDIQFIDEKAKRLQEHYNADHDINVDFAWPDAEILHIVRMLIDKVRVLEAEIKEIKANV